MLWYMCIAETQNGILFYILRSRQLSKKQSFWWSFAESHVFMPKIRQILFSSRVGYTRKEVSCVLFSKSCATVMHFMGWFFCYIAPLHTLYWSALKGSCVLLRDDRVVLQHMFIVAVNTMGSHHIGAIMDDVPNIVCGKSTAQYTQWY